MKFANAINYFFPLAPDEDLLAPPLLPPFLLAPPLLAPPDFDAVPTLFPFAADEDFDDEPPDFEAVFEPPDELLFAPVLAPPLILPALPLLLELLPPFAALPPDLELLLLPLFDAEVFPAVIPVLLEPDFPADDFAADDFALDAVFVVPPVVFLAVEFWVVFFVGISFSFLKLK